MQNQMNKFVLQSDEVIQTRRAQAVDPVFAEAIRQVLKANSQVIGGYFLDARKPNSEGTFFILALTLEDESKDLDLVAQQIWDMLQQFPQHKFKTFMMSSVPFKDRYGGSEFYIRQ
jgi:hypothetical protein